MKYKNKSLACQKTNQYEIITPSARLPKTLSKSIILTLFAICLLSMPTMAAKYYWVGGSGRWSDINHWSLNPGNQTIVRPTSYPLAADDVEFNDHSGFTASNNTLTFDKDAYVKNLEFLGTGIAPVTEEKDIYETPIAVNVHVYGRLVLQSGMSYKATNTQFIGAGPSSITTHGVQIDGNIIFNNVAGSWVVNDDLKISKIITLTAGTLNTNNKLITGGGFSSTGDAVRVLTLGTSVINMSGHWIYTGTNATLQPNTSEISLAGNISGATLNFTGVTGHQYHNLILRNTSGGGSHNPDYVAEKVSGGVIVNKLVFNTMSTNTRSGYLQGNNTVNELEFLGVGRIEGATSVNKMRTSSDHDFTAANCTVTDAELNGDTKFTGNCTFRKMGLVGGKTYTWSSGDEEITTDEVVSLPSPSCQLIKLVGITGYRKAYLKSDFPIHIANVHMYAIRTRGTGTFTATGFDAGENVGWTFSDPPISTLYWVGGAGSWQDPTHWSITSGGPGGTCFPNLFTNAVFDDASGFTSISKDVTLATSATCYDLLFKGTSHPPRLSAGSTDYTMSIGGSLVLQSGMMYTVTSTNFVASSLGKTITSNGVPLYVNFIFQNKNGSWTFLDDQQVSVVYFYAGTLNTNSKKLSTNYFYGSGTDYKHLDISGSVIDVIAWPTYSSSSLWQYIGASSTLNASNSKVSVVSTANNVTFTGATGHVYNDIFMSTSAVGKTSFFGGVIVANDVEIYSLSGDGTLNESKTLNNLYIKSPNTAAGIFKFYGNNTVANTISIAGNATITGNNIADKMILGDGKTYTFQLATTQTINELISPTTGCAGFLELSCASSYSFPKIKLPAGKTVHLEYARITNITAVGDLGAFTASGIDGGNTENWTFTALPYRNLYWVGGGGDWHDPTHWALSSGGVGDCLPSFNDNVVFDSNSGSITAANPVLVSTTAECHDITWQGVAGNPEIKSDGTSVINIYGSSTWQTGMTYKLETNYTSTDLDTKPITSNGVQMDGAVNFRSNGKWELSDPFITTSTFRMYNGSFDTKDYHLTAYALYGETASKALKLGTSVVEITFDKRILASYVGAASIGTAIGLNSDSWNYAGAGLDAANSHIKIKTGLFVGHNHVFNNLTVSGGVSISPTGSSYGQAFIVFGGAQFTNIDFVRTNIGTESFVYELRDTPGRIINNLRITHKTNILGSNTITGKLWVKDASLTLTQGTTQTVGAFEMEQTDDCLLMTVASSGTPVAIHATSANLSNVRYAAFKGINASNIPFSLQALDKGDNSNITFQPILGKEFYWVGGAGNWTDPTHWSLSTGGAPIPANACIPRDIDDVIFDDNSGFANTNAAARTITLATTGYARHVLFRGTSSPKPILSASGQSLYVYGDLFLQSGMTYNVTYTYLSSSQEQKITAPEVITTSGDYYYHSFYANNPAGSIVLGSDLNIPKLTITISGSFDTKGYNMSFYRFYGGTNPSQHVNIASSTLNFVLGGSQSAWNYPIGTLVADNSRLIFDKSYGGVLTGADGHVFHVIKFTSKVTRESKVIGGIVADSLSFESASSVSSGGTVSTVSGILDGGTLGAKIKNVLFKSMGTISGNNTLDRVTMGTIRAKPNEKMFDLATINNNNTIKNLLINGNANINGNNTLDTVYIKGQVSNFTGNNTYHQLAFSANTGTHTFAGGTTQSIWDDLYWSGSPCGVTRIQCSGTGPANFALAEPNSSDFVNVENISMTDQPMTLQRNSILGGGTSGITWIPGTGGLIGLGLDSELCFKSFPHTLNTDGFFPGPEATATWFHIQGLPTDSDPVGTGRTFTFNQPGKYSVLHDWGYDCNIRDTITVSRLAEVPAATINVEYPVCGVDQAHVSVNNPLGPQYQYHLELKTASNLVFQASPIFNNMLAGDYWLVVQEAESCVSDSISVTIHAPYLPATAVDIATADTAVCIGSSAILTPSSATISNDRNPVFRWYADAALTTPIVAGVSSEGVFTTPALMVPATYYLTVSCDTLCENRPNTGKAISIAINPLPIIAVSNTVPASCGGSDGGFTVNVSGTAPYQYSLNNSTWVNDPVFTGLPVGDYTVYVKDANCDAIPINVEIPSKTNTGEDNSFGDAPLSYGIASHQIKECIYLGGLDVELIQSVPMPDETALTAMNDDGFSNPFADGFSDLSQTDFKINPLGQLMLKVKASNYGSTTAKLFAWIDFDQNGTFDAAEATSTSVAVGEINVNKYLEFTESQTDALRNGVTYLRLRISPDADLTATKAAGTLVNGEVEDYRLNFDRFHIRKTAEVKGKAAPADRAEIGDTIVYQLHVTNNRTFTTTFGVFDFVPPHTTYITGGFWEDDKMSWDPLNLTAWETRILSFEVRVVDYPKLDPSHQIHNIAYMHLGADTVSSALDCYTAPITVEALRADDDCAILFKGQSLVNYPVNINDNDPKREVVSQSIITNGTRGTATLNADGTLNYVLNASETDFVGLDSVQYHITVPNDKDSAWVRIAIVDPLGEFTACAGSIRIGMKPIPQVTYTWYQLDGTPIATHADGTDDITINMGTADTVFHVAATIGTCTTDRLEVKVKKSELVSVPDIRVQVCPQPGFSIELNSLIDVEYYLKAKFTNSVLGLSGIEGTSELLHSSTLLANPGTHKILYSFESLCGISNAVMYVKTLHSATSNIRDTVRICKDFAANIHLKQILGLEVMGGTWTGDGSLAPIGNYVSILNGAYVFNGNKAWADAKGTLVDGNRHFVFKYNIPAGNACMPAQDRELVIVLTP